MQKETLSASSTRAVLVLGGYGLIGSEATRTLLENGCRVIGFGRDEKLFRASHANLTWIAGDLRQMQEPQDWQALLRDVDVVVNCSGALQDSAKDDLEAVHHKSIATLAQVCADFNVHIVQISAVGASLDAETKFMASKGRGDEAIRKSGVSYTIFRPGLVLAKAAYGGTELIRMIAAIPWVLPMAFGDTRVHTTCNLDLAKAVLAAVKGDLPPKFEADLVADHDVSLSRVIQETRRWLGFGAPRIVFSMPRTIVSILSRGADVLGLLGWRSPLRNSAMRVLEKGIGGDPVAWQEANGFRLKSFDETLGNLASERADRITARVSLLFPLIIATLSIFWFASGILGILRFAEAQQVLRSAGWSGFWAGASVLFWSFVDIALAFAILVRRWSRLACIGMCAVAMIYLIAAAIVTPWIWLDPLGPMVKVIPAICLSCVAALLSERR